MTAIALKQDKNILQTLLQDCISQTKTNPFQPSMMIWNDAVGLDLVAWQGQIHISAIMTFVDKNSGHASACMKWLCALADQYQVALELEVSPIPNAGAREGTNLKKTQLKTWYRRLGFVKKSGDMMVRTPR